MVVVLAAAAVRLLYTSLDSLVRAQGEGAPKDDGGQGTKLVIENLYVRGGWAGVGATETPATGAAGANDAEGTLIKWFGG